jgi:hypothetical protein
MKTVLGIVVAAATLVGGIMWNQPQQAIAKEPPLSSQMTPEDTLLARLDYLFTSCDTDYEVTSSLWTKCLKDSQTWKDYLTFRPELTVTQQLSLTVNGCKKEIFNGNQHFVVECLDGSELAHQIGGVALRALMAGAQKPGPSGGREGSAISRRETLQGPEVHLN